MKRIKIIAVLLSVFLLFAACEFERQDSDSFQNLAKEREQYLDAISQISQTFMSANFTVEVCYIDNLNSERITLLGSGAVYKRTNLNGEYRYYLLTNHHVTHSQGDISQKQYKVLDYKNREFTAELYDENIAYDLAILTFVSSEEFYIPQFASSNARIGQGVFAIGQPQGQKNAVTFGYVKYYRTFEFDWTEVDFECLFHSAFIDRGNSGGVLINKNLQIVGINFAGGTYEVIESGKNISISVPVEKVLEYLAKMESFAA